MNTARKRQDAADFLTAVIHRHWPNAFPAVEIEQSSEHFSIPPYRVCVEYTGLTGQRETFTTWSMDPTQDNDAGA